MGGKVGAEKLRRIKERARKRGSASLDLAVLTLNRIMRDPDAPRREQIKCACELLDRFGHPKQPQQETVTEWPVKLYDMRGWDTMPQRNAGNGGKATGGDASEH